MARFSTGPDKSVSMHENAKGKLIEMGLTAGSTVGILGVLGGVLFVAFHYSSGSWPLPG